MTKPIETHLHDGASRSPLPAAGVVTALEREAQRPTLVPYERRNRDLDPQLVWRGKDEQDWSDLYVPAPPLYVQEQISPRALISDLLRPKEQLDLFGDFDYFGRGLPDYYQHDQHWTNRLILGDSLQVMASLAEREGLRGKVQCIYLDPPYGIRFNSNFQWSTTSRDVKDGNPDHITREPEQVKAFRDTWRDGIHSYLTYLRDRLTVARDLLTDSGSIFVQIGDENVHRVRAVMDEVFGDENFVSEITFRVTANLVAGTIGRDSDYILWYARSRPDAKYRQLYKLRTLDDDIGGRYGRAQLTDGSRVVISETRKSQNELLSERALIYRHDNLTSQGSTPSGTVPFTFHQHQFHPGKSRHWTTAPSSLDRLGRANRLGYPTLESLAYVRFFDDFPVSEHTSVWRDTATGAFTEQKTYVVQTNTKVIERCILMATDPGDLVLDPTCGSGTTAYVAEQWGRRWITIDTSRVALALARARIMGARYPYYLLTDSFDGQKKEAELTGTVVPDRQWRADIRQGFVYERVPHITLKSIANNSEIDVIWDDWQQTLEPLLEALNAALGTGWQEWEIPREAGEWPDNVKQIHADWWQARIARQRAIDASIAAKADFEYLYDKPYADNRKVRVAGPFTVESLLPHRVLSVDEDGDLIDVVAEATAAYGFVPMILDTLRRAGVQQAHKEDKIDFTSLEGWPGDLVCAEGRYSESGIERRAAIFIGPEFGTVSRPDLAEAAREAAEAGFDVLIACAFNYDAHASDYNRLGRIPILKARMNADLHMATDLANTGKGNLFVIFGEPDISILEEGDQLRVRVNGVDVFHPNTGEVRADGPDGIACWFVDTDYDAGQGFFVRHAYFLGANDPYKALRTTLRAEIDEAAWESLHSAVSRPFDRPTTNRIAVKVINHLGDEVMKVFRV